VGGDEPHAVLDAMGGRMSESLDRRDGALGQGRSPGLWRGIAPPLKLESRVERGDGMRLLAVALTLSLANFVAASAQTATPDSENGRYSFNSRGRRRAAARYPHRPGLAGQLQRCRLGLQGGRRWRPRSSACRAPGPRFPHALRLSGTLPPLSASFVMTCFCSQTFIAAEPSRAPV